MPLEGEKVCNPGLLSPKSIGKETWLDQCAPGSEESAEVVIWSKLLGSLGDLPMIPKTGVGVGRKKGFRFESGGRLGVLESRGSHHIGSTLMSRQ